MAKNLSQAKAAKMLHEKDYTTEKQRRYFGWVASGRKNMGGNIDPNGYLMSNMQNWQDHAIIPGNTITTQGMAFPIMANNQMVYPNTGEYTFPGANYVYEEPVTHYYNKGGKHRWGTYHMGGNHKKAPKGYHYMPDGSLMKDSDMYQLGGMRYDVNSQYSGMRGDVNPLFSDQYYQANAKLAGYKDVLNERLKQKNPEAFSNYFRGLADLRRSGQITNALNYVQNTPYNEFLSPQETREALGDEGYNQFLQSLRTVNSANTLQGMQPLAGLVEGEGNLEGLNYGRRFASMQVTPSYTRRSSAGKQYSRNYSFNPLTGKLDFTEEGDVSMRPEGADVASFRRGGMPCYECGGRFRFGGFVNNYR